jgi:hypothetical protein
MKRVINLHGKQPTITVTTKIETVTIQDDNIKISTCRHNLHFLNVGCIFLPNSSTFYCIYGKCTCWRRSGRQTHGVNHLTVFSAEARTVRGPSRIVRDPRTGAAPSLRTLRRSTPRAGLSTMAQGLLLREEP